MKHILCFENQENTISQKRNLRPIKNASIDFVYSTSDLRNQLRLQGYNILVFVGKSRQFESTELQKVRNLFPLKVIDVPFESLDQNLDQFIKSSIDGDFQLELQSVITRFKVLSEALEKKSIIEFSQMFPARFEKYIETVHAALLKKNTNELSFQMHTLKSLSANVGGSKLPKMCEHVEYQKTNDFDFEIPVFVNCIFLEYKNLNEVLKRAAEIYQH